MSRNETQDPLVGNFWTLKLKLTGPFYVLKLSSLKSLKKLTSLHLLFIDVTASLIHFTVCFIVYFIIFHCMHYYCLFSCVNTQYF